MKMAVEFGAVSEMERVVCGKSVEWMEDNGFILMPDRAIWVPFRFYFKDRPYHIISND